MTLNSLRLNLTHSIFNDLILTIGEGNPISYMGIEYTVARYLVAIDDAVVRIQIKSELDTIPAGEAKGLGEAIKEINLAVELIRRSMDTSHLKRQNENNQSSKSTVQKPVRKKRPTTTSKNGRNKRAKKQRSTRS